MVEHRKHLRSRGYLSGRLAGGLHDPTMDCIIRNISAEGARITLKNSAWIPEEFDLGVTQHEMVFRARVVWRRFDEFGLTFVMPQQEPGPDRTSRADGDSIPSRAHEHLARRTALPPDRAHGHLPYVPPRARLSA